MMQRGFRVSLFNYVLDHHRSGPKGEGNSSYRTRLTDAFDGETLDMSPQTESLPELIASRVQQIKPFREPR